MKAEEYFKQHEHKASYAWHAPVITARRVKAGDLVEQFYGLNETVRTPLDGWQIYSQGRGSFMTDDEMAHYFVFEPAACVEKAGQKRGLCLLVNRSFGSDSGSNPDHNSGRYRYKIWPDDKKRRFMRVDRPVTLDFEGQKKAVPAGAVLYENLPLWGCVSMATGEQFTRDFKLAPPSHSSSHSPSLNGRPQLRRVK